MSLYTSYFNSVINKHKYITIFGETDIVLANSCSIAARWWGVRRDIWRSLRTARRTNGPSHPEMRPVDKYSEDIVGSRLVPLHQLKEWHYSSGAWNKNSLKTQIEMNQWPEKEQVTSNAVYGWLLRCHHQQDRAPTTNEQKNKQRVRDKVDKGRGN